MVFKGEIPYVRLLIPLIAGIVSALYIPSNLLFRLACVAFISSIFLLTLLLWFYKSLTLIRNKWMMGMLFHLVILLAGYISCFHSAEKNNSDYFPGAKADAFVVTVRNEPQFSGNVLRFEASVEQYVRAKTIKNASGRIMIGLRLDSLRRLEVAFGNRLLIPAYFFEVDPPFNPGEFNFKKYLASRKIYHQTFLDQGQIRVLNQPPGDRLLAYALKLRKSMVNKFYRYLDNKDGAALAATLILGYRADLSKDLLSAYSKTGTMHILSVSGMHVMIIFIVLNFLVKPLRRYDQMRYLNAILMVSLIWFYALITGFSPSVCRAATMLSFVIIGKALNRSLNTYNLLAISAFLLLLYNPFFIQDVGFQLSYLAVTGLIYFHPKIYSSFYLKNRMMKAVWSYTCLSLAAQLATFPLSVYYFHQFPVYFLISNLIIVLPVTMIMYAGIAFMFIPSDILLVPLGNFLNALISYTNNTLFYIEDLPFASIGGIWISRWETLILYLAIGSIMWARTTRQKLPVYVSLSLMGFLCLIMTIENVRKDSNTELIFFSLHKNSAVAFVHGGQAYLISDLLDDAKIFSYSIMPALESRRVSGLKKISSEASFANRDINIKPGYLQLGDTRVLKWTRQLKLNTLPLKRVSADIVLLSGNPFVSVKLIRKHVNFSTLVIDATNSNTRIREWQAECRKLRIPVYVLKKQPAYILSKEPDGR